MVTVHGRFHQGNVLNAKPFLSARARTRFSMQACLPQAGARAATVCPLPEQAPVQKARAGTRTQKNISFQHVNGYNFRKLLRKLHRFNSIVNFAVNSIDIDL